MRDIFAVLFFVGLSVVGIKPPAVTAQHLGDTTYQEVARVGDFGGDIEFGRIAGIVVDTAGFVWVADRMYKTLVVLNPRLERVRTVGREGGGPGEFRSLVQLGVVGDTITAFDVSQSRLSLFDRSGNFIRSYTEAPVTPTDSPDVTHRPAEEILGRGALLQKVIYGRRGDPELGVVLLRFDPSKQARLPLARLRRESNDAHITLGSSGYAFVPRPVVTTDLYAVDPAGGALVVVNQMPPPDPARVVVSVRTLTHTRDTASVIRLSVPPRPIEPSTVREELRPRAERFAATVAARFGHGRQEGVELYMEAMDIPAYQAPFDRLVLSRTGEIYLREGAFGLQRARWLVLDRRGKIKDRFSLPSDVDIMAVDRGRLIGRTLGAYEESVLAVWERR